jgi:hypothetical protein
MDASRAVGAAWRSAGSEGWLGATASGSIAANAALAIFRRAGAMQCCAGCATELRVTVRDGIEIAYCPDCRGVWLDRDELEKLLRATEVRAVRYVPHQRGAMGVAPSPTPAAHRPGSFLTQLFEFD